MNDIEYLEQQFNKSLINNPQNIKIKIVSENGESNYINISMDQARAILNTIINTIKMERVNRIIDTINLDEWCEDN